MSSTTSNILATAASSSVNLYASGLPRSKIEAPLFALISLQAAQHKAVGKEAQARLKGLTTGNFCKDAQHPQSAA